MSGFLGIFNRNGNAVEKEMVQTMLDASDYWEADEKDTWSEGFVALGHTMLWNTPESKYEHLPLKKDAIVLTMDARIDNREELAKEIALPDRSLSEIGDSEFILSAYKKWGDECPNHLLGDFAFAIWDETKQQLFCARDHVGVKQFYYHVSETLFLFGNDLKGLTQYLNISKEINDEAVANYIVNHQLLSNTLTFFETFMKLPPAHTLIVSNSKIEEKCYWRLEDAPKVKLPNAEAYAKKLRELLEEAVYARMRSDYPITSHLSGGLDSSSIAVLAARKLKEKGEKLLAFNWVQEPGEGDDPEYYEWANSKMIAETEDIDHHYVSLTSKDIAAHMSERNIVYGETTQFWYEYPVREAVQKSDSRTILSGWGGDELATYHGQSFYADLFMHGKFLRLFKEVKVRMKKKKGFKPLLGFIYHCISIPLVARNLYCKMPKITCDEATFPFVQKEFMTMVEKENNRYRILTMQPQKTIREHMMAYWDNAHIQSRIESWETASKTTKIEYKYPLLDKRIIEYILGVPVEYFVQDSIGRYLFRNIVKDLLPKNIVWNNTKTEPQRVKRLSILSLDALKHIVSDLKFDSSKYIMIDQLFIEVNDIRPNQLDRTDILKGTSKNTLPIPKSEPKVIIPQMMPSFI